MANRRNEDGRRRIELFDILSTKGKNILGKLIENGGMLIEKDGMDMDVNGMQKINIKKNTF